MLNRLLYAVRVGGADRARRPGQVAKRLLWRTRTVEALASAVTNDSLPVVTDHPC